MARYGRVCDAAQGERSLISTRQNAKSSSGSSHEGERARRDTPTVAGCLVRRPPARPRSPSARGREAKFGVRSRGNNRRSDPLARRLPPHGWLLCARHVRSARRQNDLDAMQCVARAKVQGRESKRAKAKRKKMSGAARRGATDKRAPGPGREQPHSPIARALGRAYAHSLRTHKGVRAPCSRARR